MEIIINNTEVKVTPDEGKEANLEDITLTLLGVLNGATAQVSTLVYENEPESLQPLRQELFDMFNFQFSQFLNNVFPEISLRPDLTEEAILKAENDLIEQKAKEAGVVIDFTPKAEVE